MTVISIKFAVCAALMAFSSVAHATTDTCSFRAYSDESDPQGTNVRSGPGKGFPIIGVLKTTHAEEGDFSPEFDVRRFKDGWVEIGDAVAGQYGDGSEETVFHGPGWVSAKLIRFEIEDPALRSAPSISADEVVNLGYLDGDLNPWGLDRVRVEAIHSCDGPFLNVTLVNLQGDTATGWATDLCENQSTTCS